MKTLTLLLALSAFAASAQTIRIADNNPNAPTGPNIYTGTNALQNALNAAAVGDIVYVQPSLTAYPAITINKRITLRGIGFNTGKDLPLNSSVVSITLTNTADNTTNASGTTIEGISVVGVPNVSWPRISLGVKTGSFDYVLRDITISNCAASVYGLYRENGYMPIENLTVKDCNLGFDFTTSGSVTNLLVFRNYLYRIRIMNGSLSSSIFSNNIIVNFGDNQNAFGYAATSQGLSINSLIITNNNFLGQNSIGASRFMQHDLQDAIVSNNIFYGMAPLGATSGGSYERNSFTNNLSFGTSNNALPPVGTGVGNTGSNNIVNQDPLFVNAPYNTIYASTMDFNLQTTSPAKNAGSDGTDIGITGGAYPVTAGNILLKPSSAPVIMQFNPAAVVPQNQPVKSNIKAKAN